MGEKDPVKAARTDIHADVGAIRRLLAKKVAGRTFELRLGDAIVRDIRGGPVTANDGYSPGGGGASQKNGISDPVGSTVLIRDSGRGALVDLVHAEATAARAALTRALAELQLAERHLKTLDDFTGVAEQRELCELCTLALKGTGIEPDEMFRFTDIGARLPHPAKVCEWHFDTIRKPPHKVPDVDRIRRRYTAGRDRISA